MTTTREPEPGTWRGRFNDFIEANGLLWELAMGLLAVVYVALPFLAEGTLAAAGPQLALFEGGLTILFLLEFFLRLGASRDRLDYLRRHWIDAVALIPVVRGLRVARQVRRLATASSGRAEALEVES